MKELIDLFVREGTTILTSGGPLVGILLIILESIFPVLPLSVFITLNAVSFGNFAGFFISWIATCLGCWCSFFLFRYLFQKKVERFLKKKNSEKINRWMEQLSNISFSNLTLLFAIPFTPAFLINIAAGLSELSFKKFALSSLVGKVFMVYFWGYVGTSLLESLTDITVLLKIGLMLGMAYIISKWISRKLNIA